MHVACLREYKSACLLSVIFEGVLALVLIISIYLGEAIHSFKGFFATPAFL
jgi:hypothetical protein